MQSGKASGELIREAARTRGYCLNCMLMSSCSAVCRAKPSDSVLMLCLFVIACDTVSLLGKQREIPDWHADQPAELAAVLRQHPFWPSAGGSPDQWQSALWLSPPPLHVPSLLPAPWSTETATRLSTFRCCFTISQFGCPYMWQKYRAAWGQLPAR